MTQKLYNIPEGKPPLTPCGHNNYGCKHGCVLINEENDIHSLKYKTPHCPLPNPKKPAATEEEKLDRLVIEVIDVARHFKYSGEREIAVAAAIRNYRNEYEQQAVEKALKDDDLINEQIDQAILNERVRTRRLNDSIFISHIEKHLKNMDIKTYGGRAICKICNKTVDEIYAEEKQEFEHETQRAVEKAVRATLAIPSGRLLDNDLAQACEQIAENEKHGVGAKFKEGEFCAYDYLMDKAKKLREGVEKHD